MTALLVIGGSGQLGTALRAAANAPVIAPGHAEFDINTGRLDEWLERVQPAAVINCAAFHNVDRCEREPDAAFAANAIAVDRMASTCARSGVPFVTVSTDYVFSGDAQRAYREDDRPGPRTAYGASKLAGEFLALRYPATTLVIRTSAVFGTTGTSSKGYTLIDKVLAQAERGETTRMVSDVTFSPSFAPHIARSIFDLLDRRARGVHHVTNSGSCTWYEYVRTAFTKAGLADAPLEPITYAALGNATQRPMYSPLENTTFARLGVMAMPAWQDALDEYLAARRIRLAST
jgi:dTDP-4-dehydrorhamnose reductase